MIPGPSEQDYVQRGQLPVFIPNYYRGAYHQYPRTAGRSSQLFNTGTVSWVYRCLVEGLFGLKGDDKGLLVDPQLPSEWSSAKATREFRGAIFHVTIERAKVTEPSVSLDGVKLAHPRIDNIVVGKEHQVSVLLPQ